MKFIVEKRMIFKCQKNVMEVQDVIEQHVDVRENEVTHLQLPINLIVLVVEMV
jgi:hypothetical protein